MPLLSICIITYNRSRDCDETARAFLREINGRWDQIELIIADNASTDDTRELIEGLPERERIQYVRHAENLGAIGNYIYGLRTAKGEYVWIAGDDDKYHPGVVDKVLEVIKSRAPGLIHLNCEVKDGYDGQLITASYYGLTAMVAQVDSVRTMQYMLAVDDGGFTFISCNVMKTALAREQISRPGFISTLATPLEVTICCGLAGGFYFVREILVTGYFNANSWSANLADFYFWGRPVAWMAMWRRGLRTVVLLRRLATLASAQTARYYWKSPARLGAVLRRALRG
ncbi:MAG: glycosyltransferase family 2 protein [Opitutales bacterium]|jgi:glycosyltransferase involved in cell wall biosynthesis